MSSQFTLAGSLEGSEKTHHLQVVFPAGNPDFRAARNRCARACRKFNQTPDDADPEERAQKWLDIIRPDRDRSEDRVLAVTHDQTFANPTLKAKTPFVKPPVYIDYGIRLHVGGSTFINRNCMIMDTPVADVVIGEGCNIGANCTIIGVTHPLRLDERLQRHSIGQPVTIGNDVWIGANVTIFGGVTIGDGAVIGACSLVKRDVPPMSVAFGTPARVVKYLRDVKPTVTWSPTAGSLEEAVGLRNRLPMKHESPFEFDEGGDAEGSEEEEEQDQDEDGDVCGEQRPSATRSRLNTVRRERRLAERLELDREEELRELLLRERRQKERMRRFEVEAIAVVTVAVTLLMAFFFTGVWFGASRVSLMGA